MPYDDVMVTKNRRMEMRADEQQERLITEAAQVARMSVSAFVLRAASDEAGRLLARTDTTVMPAAQFDAFMSSLDEPDPAPRLARAAARAARTEV